MAEEKRSGLFARLRGGLTKTRGRFTDRVKRVFSGHARLDDDVYEELEQILIEADIGVETSLEIVEDMRRAAKEQRLGTPEELYDVLKSELCAQLEPGAHTLTWSAPDCPQPHVTLVAGVNGSGKTTTIGKLAAERARAGKSVILAAADTFRAAAIEQLSIWAERSGATVIKDQHGADPAAVAYNATDAALARNVDHVIIDTAGRLHTKVNLMAELQKIQRVVGKRLAGAPHEVLLVLDATTGQNGLEQARQFTEALTVTGTVLTKLDGTAKGGIVIAIQRQLGIPIKLIGVGEAIDDLQPFRAEDFVAALVE
ncbi:MAG TPA: signal recognition particle-docking protein FtsY [Candidatus Hydrogenedentes bacterium]|nr:signal recognition particle-docking protein FtsY [Candidatus Hydrogenedentota bacterium]HPG65699.1 signal recognition particle-docking protein FtsY [Candidatus Hydrogenedentota bacterium]